jgi:hypothetical protein
MSPALLALVAAVMTVTTAVSASPPLASSLLALPSSLLCKDTHYNQLDHYQRLAS